MSLSLSSVIRTVSAQNMRTSIAVSLSVSILVLILYIRRESVQNMRTSRADEAGAESPDLTDYLTSPNFVNHFPQEKVFFSSQSLLYCYKSFVGLIMNWEFVFVRTIEWGQLRTFHKIFTFLCHHLHHRHTFLLWFGQFGVGGFSQARWKVVEWLFL